MLFKKRDRFSNLMLVGLVVIGSVKYMEFLDQVGGHYVI